MNIWCCYAGDHALLTHSNKNGNCTERKKNIRILWPVSVSFFFNFCFVWIFYVFFNIYDFHLLWFQCDICEQKIKFKLFFLSNLKLPTDNENWVIGTGQQQKWEIKKKKWKKNCRNFPVENMWCAARKIELNIPSVIIHIRAKFEIHNELFMSF